MKLNWSTKLELFFHDMSLVNSDGFCNADYEYGVKIIRLR